LRALAVTTAKQWEELPDIPTVGECRAGLRCQRLDGIGAPKGTPVEITIGSNRRSMPALLDLKLKARLPIWAKPQYPPPPPASVKLIAEETRKWGKLMRAANMQSE